MRMPPASTYNVGANYNAGAYLKPFNSNQQITGVEADNTMCKCVMNQQGLALKTYQSDIFNNWVQTEWITGTNGIQAITAVDVSSGKLNLDSLNLSQKVYNMLNRVAVSGGSYEDWIEAVFDQNFANRAETPIYMGGLSKEIVFQEVISQAATADQPLGSLGGRGVLSNKHKGGHIIVKVEEPSYIIGIVSITPRAALS